MTGFVTLAVGDGYLQRAAAFALSARRFGLPTTLMYRDVDIGPYRSLFAAVEDLGGRPTINRSPIAAARELKKYAYESSASVDRCAFVDADSLVIRDPRPMFDNLAEVPIHTPCARNLRDDEHWTAGRITARQAARAMGMPDERPIPTLNGGFLLWQRGETAQRVLADYESLFKRLAAHFEDSRMGRYPVADELCLAIAMALHDIPRFKSDTSIGIWDAGQLRLDIAKQEFECMKHYYWEEHRFRPYIAHFGGSKISPLYRHCVEFLCKDTAWRFPLFDSTSVVETRTRPNAYSFSDPELKALAEFVRREGIGSVLEFGPGRSTECFLRSGCDVWSFEYQDRWLEHYRRVFRDEPKLSLHRFENIANVELSEAAERRFDLALVDAPTGEHRPEGIPHSRLNMALAAARHADTILLHDVDRDGERATLNLLCGQGWQWQPLPGAPRLAVLRRGISSEKRGHATRMCYDFDHWPSLPRVSCQCITYGRTTLLDEAVECFLQQDYPGEKELVILNDLAALQLHFDHPDVRVINLPYRMRTIGEKRNACVALCTGDVIFVWDDDDISLPHRISYSLTRMTNHRYYKADRMWYWDSGVIKGAPHKSVCHPMGCWSAEFFDEVGGYPHIQSGQDVGLEERFKGPHRHVEATDPADVYYIYRFPGTGSYHLSSAGYGKGYDESARYVAQAAIEGEYEIKPVWRQDYSQLVAAELAKSNDDPAVRG